jgi:hypothetical protein
MYFVTVGSCILFGRNHDWLNEPRNGIVRQAFTISIPFGSFCVTYPAIVQFCVSFACTNFSCASMYEIYFHCESGKFLFLHFVPNIPCLLVRPQIKRYE